MTVRRVGAVLLLCVAGWCAWQYTHQERVHQVETVPYIVPSECAKPPTLTV